MVLPARGLSVEQWCYEHCGELGHGNGHHQIGGESDLTEAIVSFS